MHKVNNRLSVKLSNSGKPKLISTPGVNRATAGIGKKASLETANLGFGGATGGASGLSISGIGASQRNNLDLILTGILNDKQKHIMRMMYRDIYNYDPVGGSAVDMTATLPFSDFSLTGCPDNELEVYVSSIERLSLKTQNSYIHANELVYGEFVATAVFSSKEKVFTDMVPYSLEQCDIQYLPFISMEPSITVRPDGELKQFLNSTEPEIVQLKKHIPEDLLRNMSQGEFVLDPLTTIYMARTTVDRSEPTSYFRRLIPIYLLEKTLTRGTLVEATKRQRAFLHAMVGNEDWEPTEEELSAVVEMLQKADLDPLGPVIATRDGIQLSEARCLHGNSLIPTDKGFIRIKDIVKHNPSKLKRGAEFDIDLNVKGLDGDFVNAYKWIYQGKNRVYNLKTKYQSFTATQNHKMVTVKAGGDFELKRIGDLTENDFVLADAHGKRTSHTLKLPLQKCLDSVICREENSHVIMPKIMTPELSYLLGVVTSEGKLSEHCIQVRSDNSDVLEKVQHCFEKEFNVRGEIVSKNESGNSLEVNKKAVVKAMRALGCVPKTTKRFPWTIMEANSECQLSFLAAYLDGSSEGTNKSELRFFSESKRVLKYLHTIISNLGYRASVFENNIQVCPDDVGHLYEELQEHSALTRELEFTNSNSQFGIPPYVFIDLLDARKAGQGSIYTTDDGSVVHIEEPVSDIFRQYRHENSYLLYEKGLAGYSKELSVIEQVSEKLYRNIVRLFEIQPRFEPVISITEKGKAHTYDISISEANAPVFVADGLLTKNSGGDFWKSTDIYDITTSLKLRALQISESFLSGDSTYATAEINLSVYMENLKYNRAAYTQKLFYNKLFPVIAAVNGFIDTEKSQSKKRSTVHHKVRDGSKYRIPKVHWHKSLDPVSDTQTIEMLNILSEKGIPVPLRLWAAAGGMSLESIEEDLEKDIDIRKQFALYNQELEQAAQELGVGGDEYDDEYASIRKKRLNRANAKLFTPSGSIVPRSIFSRDYGENSEVFERTVTGKKRHVVRQNHANKKINEIIAKAVANLSDKNHYQNTVRKARRFGNKIL